MMFFFWLPFLLIHVSLHDTVKAASPSQLQRPAITLTENTNQTTADHHVTSLAGLDNELSLFFTQPGGPIPRNELRRILSSASDDVQAHFHDADMPISKSSFETNMTFPRTGDYIYLWVYAYGYGLSWRQLGEALMKLQMYMLGIGPSHPASHCQELEFYVQLVTGMETARGAVEFTPGRRAEAKRSLDPVALQLVQANFSSKDNADLPIVFRIAPGLDLKVTELGIPIPESTILTTLEKAFTDVVINHDDIDAKVPKNRYPYSFNATSGKPPSIFTTEVSLTPSSSKRGITWAQLCLLYYGIRDFMRSTKHFNVLEFELIDARLGLVGNGNVQYGPSNDPASQVVSNVR